MVRRVNQFIGCVAALAAVTSMAACSSHKKGSLDKFTIEDQQQPIQKNWKNDKGEVQVDCESGDKGEFYIQLGGKRAVGPTPGDIRLKDGGTTVWVIWLEPLHYESGAKAGNGMTFSGAKATKSGSTYTVTGIGEDRGKDYRHAGDYPFKQFEIQVTCPS